MPDRPRASRLPCESSIGSVFHSLQATSQALQPMQTEVSVKKPTRAGWSGSYPASPCTSGSGPNSRVVAPSPWKAGLAELTEVIGSPPRSTPPPLPRPLPSRARLLLPGRRLDRRAPVAAHPARLHPGPPAVGLDELHQLRPARPAARPDVGGADLVLLDVGVRVQHDAQQVVGRVAGRQPALGPVVGHPDLVHDRAVGQPDRPHPL